MSYLLKALQKAEQERQQNQDSTQSTQVVKVESKLPKSLVVIVSLLVLATFWQIFSGSVQKKSIDESGELALITEQKLSSETQRADSQSLLSEVKVSQPVNTSLAESIEPAEGVIKDLSELTTNELTQIPSLELASHIYSSAPEYRSVVINGQTYQQGMLIQAGILLDEIVQSGIVINVKGQKVLLPKGISWIASQNVK